MHLDELNRTIPGRPGFDNFEQSYGSAAPWPRGTLGCILIFKSKIEKDEKIRRIQKRLFKC
ncbi:unnamed protein product [Meloidogyne enterolobii]|uniref:Uncharacterized protein n=1 Tax=Meloidogyne enterolobii TaxID=390850 RepID=A0ACB0Y3U9_MELEN